MFEDRSYGGLWSEFYEQVAAKIYQLRNGEMDPVSLERLGGLEKLLEPADKVALSALSEEESLEVWGTAHRTGDPLADKWEREIAAGHTPDLDEG